MSALTEQDRLQMLRRASASERRNSPRGLVYLALALALAGGVYAGTGWASRRSAVRSLAAAQDSQRIVRTQLSELESLSSPASGGGVVIHERLASPVASLERAAQAAEFPDPKFESERIERDLGEAHRRIFRFKEIRGASAAGVLRWVDRVERDIPGMRVYSMDLRPSADRGGWDVTVQFARLERKQ